MPPIFSSLADAARWFEAWLAEAALPLWAGAGRDAGSGGFQEALSLAAEPWAAAWRSRVQTRQTWVYATAGAEGFGAAYGALARRAFDLHRARYLRPDGLFARAASASGEIVDPAAQLYDQAFALLAMAAMERLEGGGFAAGAKGLIAALSPLRHAAGGWREVGEAPFQANAHMHLLEAALAWEDVSAGEAGRGWAALADEIAELALGRFVDPRSGAVREFFDADWRALDDRTGGLLEPGHQFEWAWLLDRWGRARAHAAALAAARRLFAAGLAGVEPATGIAVGALWSDLTVRERETRLWAQTEHLKAALIFGTEAQALHAAQGLTLFLETPVRGLWRDKRRADGGFVEAPAPATSLYHLVGAILPLRDRT
jgi:mannose-6-phosphate isomerase